MHERRKPDSSIVILSVTIPSRSHFLILGPATKINLGFSTANLPLFHAILNSTTAILLLASLYFIKNHGYAHTGGPI